jgi:decaprenylphospho-beta-D-ribofuranose 2-oxidase
MGRSYGDAAQNAGGTLLDLQDLRSIGPIDDQTGEITCGAGVSIDALLRSAVPQGWFVPVTPGTRMISLGGAVAADVHGKNHHRDGSIGSHVTSLDIVDGRGDRREVAPSDAAYGAVVGGLGLAAAVTAVRLRLRRVSSSWVQADICRTRDLDDTMATLEDVDRRHRYSVAWLDCLATGRGAGRGIVTSGDHAEVNDLPGHVADPLAFDPAVRITAPPWAPSSILSRNRVAAFNQMYYRLAGRNRSAVPVPLAGFFHPLDSVRGWNRLYGRTGFVQYQFAAGDPRLIERALTLLRDAAAPAFLAVLKRFGPGSTAPLSFPVAGWTLALDLPADPALGPVLDRLDRAVADAGGRVYLAKDARLSPSLVATMYPDMGRWAALRDELDPLHVFRSDLSRRLHL